MAAFWSRMGSEGEQMSAQNLENFDEADLSAHLVRARVRVRERVRVRVRVRARARARARVRVRVRVKLVERARRRGRHARRHVGGARPEEG